MMNMIRKRFIIFWKFSPEPVEWCVVSQKHAIASYYTNKHRFECNLNRTDQWLQFHLKPDIITKSN